MNALFSKPNVFWGSSSLSHPDINLQALRWYGQNKDFKKQIPKDIRITPVSLLLWYLGDGNLYIDKKVNCPRITMCTDSFLREDILNILVPKIKNMGIKCSVYRTTARGKSDKFRIMIFGRNVINFLNLIGGTSPINCYAYKFKYPKWMGMIRLTDIGLDKKCLNRAYYYLHKDRKHYKKYSYAGRWTFTPKQVIELKNKVGA